MDVKALAAQLIKGRHNAKGITAREVAERLGTDIKAARMFIQGAIAANKCKLAGHRAVARIDGQLGRVPVYKFR